MTVKGPETFEHNIDWNAELPHSAAGESIIELSFLFEESFSPAFDLNDVTATATRSNGEYIAISFNRSGVSLFPESAQAIDDTLKDL